MNNNYVPMFISPIFTSLISQDISPLLNECKKQQSLNQQGRIVSNRGGWQSPNIFSHLLDDYILDNLNEVSTILGFKNKVKIKNFWFNVNKSGNYNIPHFHPYSFLSGVLYLKCPKGSGNIIFENPIFPLLESYIETLEKFEKNPFNSYHFSLTPKESLLLIFPSWIRHNVEPGEFDGERISISFNAFM